MNQSELKNHVMQAINTLYARDSDLFSRDASEWAIAHRLAVYLEYELPGWNVDCEYNRQGPGRDPKVRQNEEKVRPDIVLHHRGRVEPEHNLLVIELKKLEASPDLEKAREYTMVPAGSRKFQYQYGLALSVIGELKLNWFTGGHEII
jgi:hypothetical protein